MDAAESRPRTSRPVERRERLLDREVGSERALTRVAAGELATSASVRRRSFADGPQRIAQRDRLGATTSSSSGGEIVELEEPAVDVAAKASSWSRRAVIAGEQLRRSTSAINPRETLEQRVDLADEASHRGNVIDRGRPPVEQLDDLGLGGHRPVGRRLITPMMPHMEAQPTEAISTAPFMSGCAGAVRARSP
jgi:hypothetical protein